MNMLKRFTAMLLILCMLFSMAPMAVLAAQTQEPEAVSAAPEEVLEPQAEEEFYRIVHLDSGRKYFTPEWIKALINEMAAAGFTHLQLAFGNDGLRFLLDDMSVTVNGTTYSSDAVKAGIHAGNEAYYNESVDELTEAEMDEIIAHAKKAGISIIPHVNMPGHMDAILDAIEYVGIPNAHFTGYSTSARSLNLNNSDAVAFTQALLQKYVDYFDDHCDMFHIGADEFANDAYGTSMGFPSMGSDLYAKFAEFVNDCAGIVKNAGMTPLAWNDGISYTKYDADFDEDITVTYWSPGWGGYNVASADKLSQNGHDLINTNGTYYYILGADDCYTSGGTSNHKGYDYTAAAGFSNTVFNYSRNVADPVGSMFCIWSDYPGAETETEVAKYVRPILRVIGARMQDSNSYEVESVVSGGFNADGTIAEDREWVELPEEEQFGIQVSGYELTDVLVEEVPADQLPAVEGAEHVAAWDITPYVDGEAYTDRGVVALPVPEGWNTGLVKGFYVENGAAVMVEGTYAGGFYTFEMPHFSVAGIMLLDASDVYDELIELEVGGSTAVTVKGSSAHGKDYVPQPEGIASVSTELKGTDTKKELIEVTSLSGIVSGGKYVLVNAQSENVLGNSEVYNQAWKNRYDEYGVYLLEQVKGQASVDSIAWTITANGTSYNVQNADGKHITVDLNTTALQSETTNLTISEYNGVFYIGEKQDNSITYYLNNMAEKGEYVGGWTDGTVKGSLWYLYQVKEATTQDTEITFKGNSSGTAYVTIEGVTYKIVVSTPVEITINYVDGDGKVIKTDKVEVSDSATTYAPSGFAENEKFYVPEVEELEISPKTTTVYEVRVVETEFNPGNAPSLTLEYWITNAKVSDGYQTGVFSAEIAATYGNIYSEDGVAVTDLAPKNAYKKDAVENDPPLIYWHARLLDRSTNEQREEKSNDQCLNGTGFSRIRWMGQWAVYTAEGQWLAIKDSELESYQFALYYMNDMHLADEVQVGTSDWGKKGNGELGSAYLGSAHVSIAFQVVYEDGTTAPATADADGLAPYTYLVDSWGTRGVGTISIDQIGSYQIWKVTAETGTHTTSWTNDTSPVHVTGFEWDNNEMTVWEGDPVSEWSITNPSSETTKTDGIYQNLVWDEDNESILIRIYVKAEKKEDSLTVVYYDEKFNDTLYTYHISVEDGVNFTNGITPAPGTFGADRIDVKGSGIVNAMGKTQYFQTDLTQVPEAVGKYNSKLYTYASSEISEDGKILYLYYTINQSVIFPNFVVDFGLPLSFSLNELVTEGVGTVSDVSVTKDTKYGTLVYDEFTKTFTYTPNEIVRGLDVLSIKIVFDGGTTNINNVGVVPATTVYYEETFISWGTGWTVGSNAITVPQTPEDLGKKVYNYGYDPVYSSDTDEKGNSYRTDATATALGAKATFTFTGDGIQVFANSTKGSGYVSVQVQNSSGATVNLSLVDTSSTAVQVDALYGLPIVSLVDLQNMPHDTYTVTMTKIMDSQEPVYIDGIRVFNTVNESDTSTIATDGADSIYQADYEDNPDFYEVRDLVLNAYGVGDSVTSADYPTLYQQIYDASKGATGLITDETVTFAESATVQQLLDKGPKNELYLFEGQTLSFKVQTNRVVQLGMKAPTGNAEFDLQVNGECVELKSLATSVDMFYPIAGNSADATRVVTVTVKVTAGMLSVTLLKICDDPYASFVSLTEEDIKNLVNGEEPLSNPFADIEEDAYFFKSVMWALKKQLTEGTAVDRFSPEESCTRAQVVTFLWRLAGKPAPQGDASAFTDLELGAYYEQAVAWAVENGITLGTGEGTFSPDEACTRAQIVTFLYRFAGSPEVETGTPFDDMAEDAYYAPAVKWAVKYGITQGDGTENTFNPEGECQRCQIVTFLYRYMK